MNGVIGATGLFLPFASILAAAWTRALRAGVIADVWLRNRSRATRDAAPAARVAAPEERTLAQPGDQFARAVELARRGSAYAPDEERIVETIAAALGWSRTRARWFIAVNRDQLTA